jgi:hypothetical protein
MNTLQADCFDKDILRGSFTYDETTLQPQPGPRIAEWQTRFGKDVRVVIKRHEQSDITAAWRSTIFPKFLRKDNKQSKIKKVAKLFGRLVYLSLPVTAATILVAGSIYILADWLL